MVLLASSVGRTSYIRHELVGTNPERAVTAKTVLAHGVQVIAVSNNVDPVQIGESDVTENYVTLEAGKGLFIPVDDLSKVYFLGTAGDFVELMLV